MSRRYRQILALVFFASDLAATSAVWFGAYFLRFSLWPAPAGVPELELVAEGLPQVLLLAAVVYRLCGLYDVHRLRRVTAEATAVCVASGLLFLLTIALTFYRRDMYESRLALGLFLLLNALALTAGRRGLWWLISGFGRGASRRRAVIVGAGRPGRLAAETLSGNAWSGLRLMGFVDRPCQFEPVLLPRLGEVDDLPDIIREHHIDNVIVALPLERYHELPRIHHLLSDSLVELHLAPDVPSLSGARMRTLEMDGVPFVSLRENPHAGWHRVAKRGIDLAGACCALLLFAPLMALLALLVKLTSGGPVFYRQTRSGLGGRTFDILKFRSMRPGAEDATGPVWAVRGDGRCTRLGRFMRRWNLDELPQLFNVLAGDMSLVGPRPERGVFIEKFRQQVPGYALRHQVKSGITGWAQINGWRGNTSLRRRVECDLFYICHWSIWLDLKILWLTLWRGFRQRNAY